MPVTLNIDLGELPDEAEELYSLCTVANVACGGHAGDGASMKRAVAWAKAGGATVAAHPSYPDRPNFGRVSLNIEPRLLHDSVAEQCATLRKIAAAQGVSIDTVKPHGALYHDAGKHDALAHALVEAVIATIGEDAAIVGPPGSGLAVHARAKGLRWLDEGFADRGYGPDGHILPRGTPGALIEDPARAAEQARRLARTVQTICVHGDTKGAVGIARAVRAALEAEGLLA
ncbi:MAG: LamB/YcsF family protein [Polyangiales bacterium]